MTDSPALTALNVLTTEDVAHAAGLSVGSVRVMVARTRTRRDQGRAIPTDLPKPDVMVYRSPLWRKSTINQWLKKREAANLRTAEHPDPDKPAKIEKAKRKPVPKDDAKPAKKSRKAKASA